MNRWVIAILACQVNTTLASPSGEYHLKRSEQADRGMYFPDGKRVPSCTTDERIQLASVARSVRITWDKKTALVNNEEWSLRKTGEKVMIQRPRQGSAYNVTVVFWIEAKRPRGVIAYSFVGDGNTPIRGCSYFLGGSWTSG